MDDKLKAREGMIKGLREQLAELATWKNSSELEKRLGDLTHSVAMLAENGPWPKEKLRAAERRSEEVEEKAEAKWQPWAEKEAHEKGGKAVSAQRKKRQAKGKALPVEMVTMATQSDHIQEPKAIQLDERYVLAVTKGILLEKLKNKNSSTAAPLSGPSPHNWSSSADTPLSGPPLKEISPRL